MSAASSTPQIIIYETLVSNKKQQINQKVALKNH